MDRFVRLAAFCIALSLPTLLFAHGDALHIMGTVTDVTKEQIVVKTPEGASVTLVIHAKTTFEYNGLTIQDARPKIGDRLVAEAEQEGDRLVAQEVHFATPKSK